MLNMSKYCHDKGMTLEQYKQYQANVKATATALINLAKSLFATDTGLYHPIESIIPWSEKTIPENKLFILMELKAQGMEFYDNNTMLRL